MTYYNRRQFISRSTLGFAGATLGLSMLNQTSAFAANTSGYKALVGLMLKGGMDHNDTVLPVDAPSYNALVEQREGIFLGYDYEDSASSRNRENILRLNTLDGERFNGRRFGLPRELSALHEMYNSGDAAIIGNIGPLLEPVTRDQFQNGTARLPKRIFSHNDQQSTWMALSTEGARLGWGGQFADAVLESDATANPLYTSIASTSPDVFLSGRNARPFRVPEIGRSLNLETISDRGNLGYRDEGDELRGKFNDFFRKQEFEHSNIFRRDMANMMGTGINDQLGFSELIQSATPLATVFPNTRLGRQLGGIAQTISVRGTLGVSRQVFYADTGGFDSHDNQANELPARHTEVNDALAAFRAAMIELGTWNDVIVFTMSDFGRTMIGNGDGSDHGWGGHQFVMGGSVRGQRIYGDIPEPDPGHPQYTAQRGRLIPTTSVEQHAAALGGWFGLDNSELSRIFPNLPRFDAGTLGYV